MNVQNQYSQTEILKVWGKSGGSGDVHVDQANSPVNCYKGQHEKEDDEVANEFNVLQGPL